MLVIELAIESFNVARVARYAFLMTLACGRLAAEPVDAGVEDAQTSCSAMCDGACVDFGNDSKNCNRCGHDCLGGACMAGVCQPVAIAGQQGNGNSSGLAIDQTSVYWTDANGATTSSVNKVSIHGGAIVPIATGQSWTHGVAVDSSRVYWTNASPAGSLMTAPLAGGSPTVLAGGAGGSPEDVAVDGTYAYWTTAADSGFVMRTPLVGGASVAIASGQPSPQAIAIDSANVYWTNLNDQSLRRVPLDGGTVTQIDTANTDANGVAVNSTHVYWTAYVAGAVMRAPIGGGTAEVFASDQPHARRVCFHADSVYWTNDSTSSQIPASVMMASISGGVPTQLATSARAVNIAADDHAVYWTDPASGAGVWKVALP